MNILVLKPGLRSVDYSFFGKAAQHPRVDQLEVSHLDRKLQALADTLSPDMPEALAVRVNYGGTEFREPVIADAQVITRLTSLIPQAPLHLPVVLSLLESCQRIFPELPAVLCFETAFFSRLPRRECTYGIDKELSESLGLRRYGYHGLYHEAACAYAARKQDDPPRARRTLSICLEPHPEIAAVLGTRPIMSTSGATPLEGLPGHTSCGELDPSIVLMLARKLKWGPEQINTALTQQSGLLGLAGHPVMLDDVFAENATDLELARSALESRILSACGGGMAAMGGVDDIVFSGRFAQVGEILGPWLAARLTFRGGNDHRPPQCLCFTESLDEVLAERAQIVLFESGMMAGT